MKVQLLLRRNKNHSIYHLIDSQYNAEFKIYKI